MPVTLGHIAATARFLTSLIFGSACFFLPDFFPFFSSNCFSSSMIFAFSRSNSFKYVSSTCAAAPLDTLSQQPRLQQNFAQSVQRLGQMARYGAPCAIQQPRRLLL